MKHSKAPYRFEGNKIVCADNYNVATVNSHATREGRATGTLLAMAPEMLDRLISASLALSNPQNSYQEIVLNAIIETIAKARGE